MCVAAAKAVAAVVGDGGVAAVAEGAADAADIEWRCWTGSSDWITVGPAGPNLGASPNYREVLRQRPWLRLKTEEVLDAATSPEAKRTKEKNGNGRRVNEAREVEKKTKMVVGSSGS